LILGTFKRRKFFKENSDSDDDDDNNAIHSGANKKTYKDTPTNEASEVILYFGQKVSLISH